MRTITWLAAIDRSGTSCTRFSAVSECTNRANPEKRLALLTLRSGRTATMAMVVAGLAIVVAALPVESARVSGCNCALQQNEAAHQDLCVHHAISLR